MQTFTILETESDQRVDRYLRKILPSAPLSFIAKMGRTKKIRVNGKKVAPNDRIFTGDIVTIFLSDGEFDEFGKKSIIPLKNSSAFDSSLILYEDDDILAVNKPS